jgi:hypothetical protein
MKSRIPVGVVMMLVALMLSLVPAATVTAKPAAALSTCDWAQFIADISVPDGTTFTAGTAFKKTWRIKNIGTCTWTTSYSLVFVSGEKMGGPTSVNLVQSVAPGDKVDISLNLTAPSNNGHYIGYWMLKNASGNSFGIGANGDKAWWVEINVTSGGTVQGDVYDFVPNYCSASWYSSAGSLPCPGTDGDARGFVLKVDQPQLENGATNAGGGLITEPQNVFNGDIHGKFPAFHVQSGDRFRSTVNCAFGATSCYVTFRLDYQIGNGPIYNYWTFREKYEGLYYNADVDLSRLAGNDVQFILTVLATGSATGDRALWVNPYIMRPGGTPPPVTVTPVTPSPATSCDRAAFVADVTVPDGTVFAPGATFKKTWRLKNVGTCTWTTSYTMAFDSGSQMGGPNSVALPNSVAPGQNVDVPVDLTAPSTPGSYRGFWSFRNANGARFGLGSAGNISWWVDIRVISSTSVGPSYDFGTSGSPVMNGYTKVTESTAYSSSTGYGWTDTSTLESRDRSGPDDVKRDFVMSSSAARTFKVDLANKTYTVNVLQGDMSYPHDNMVVKANGTTVLPDVDTATGSFAYNSFQVTVTSGSLSLEFSDAGGSDPTWVVNAVVISNVVPTSGTDRAQFVTDVTYPDGSIVAPGQTFTKTWRLKNVGSSTWTTAYQLVFDTGDHMATSGGDPVALPNSVAPGQTVDVSVPLMAPATAGHYRGFWKFQNANGVRFGIGANYTSPWWVDVQVSGVPVTPGTPSPTPQGVQYDFAANVCSGVWFSGAGQLPCPGSDGDSRGFVFNITNPTLENGTVDSRLGLLTFPQNVWNGYIQGFYPPYHVKTGDRFQSIINCSYGSTSCNVNFRLDYRIGTGPIKTFFGPFGEKYEGQYFPMDLSLSSLVGQDVQFILTVLSNGYATGDRALWVGPVIYNSTGVAPTATNTPPSPTATATTASGTPASPTATVPTPTVPSSTPTVASPTATPPSPTATTDTSGWNTYQNAKYGFFFKFPPGSSVASQSDNSGRVNLPITAGTNLTAKWVQVSVVEGANPCKSPDMEQVTSSTNVTINGISFLKEVGTGAAAGSTYDSTAYSTVKGANNACISLTFTLQSGNLGNYTTPPPEYNKDAESAVFPVIMSTYGNQ